VIPLAEPTTWDTIIGTGGWIGTAGILVFITKQLIDSWVAHRADKRAEKEADEKSELGELTAGVGNASTVNAIMVKSVETLAAENERLQSRVQHLEIAVADRDLKIAERDHTIDQLKERVDSLVATGQALSVEITNYQNLLRQQETEVD
jgi:regulator of replication initiation timing